MGFKTFIAFIVFISFLYTSQSQTNTNFIPQPKVQNITKGQFVITNETGISYDKTFEVAANFLKSYIENGSSIVLKSNKSIQFIKDETITNSEAYHLHISQKSIQIKSSSEKGAFYAVQTLRQLLPVEFENGTFKANSIAITCQTIEDEPQFSYRGMHLDSGRHMQSIDFIKKYIDALALLKMNTFHWHLTEDQGWRIEIKKYPKLQEIAAYRNETLIGHYNDDPQQFDGKRYGGFYTQEDIKMIVAYSEKRQITIIPEIEMPGHSQAAIAAYPELGCTDEPVLAATKWGVFEEIYCTKDSTFEFLEDVLDEVLELFPSTYIHIGGDEAPKTRWKACEHCQKRIKDEGLKDEHELQNYFITRMETYLNSKGRQIIGWDEILEGGLAPNATVMSWRGIQGAIDAAKMNHNVIMTPNSHCYFDYYQSDSDGEPTAIGGFLPLEKVYHFNPIPEELTSEQAKFVLGAQGNVWTEYMPDEKQIEYMVFPRILALSEVVWSPTESKNYSDFLKRVEHFHKRLNALDINYANHLYEINGQLLSENGNLSYQLATQLDNKTIRFSTDESEPNNRSEVYVSPIKIEKNTKIKAAVFDDETQLSKTFTQQLKYHKAIGKSITLSIEPHKAYNAGGKEALINSINGSNTRFGDKEWLGFYGDDVEIMIDLDEEMEINCVSTRFFSANGQWIYLPSRISIEILDNNKKSLFGSIEQILIPETKFTDKIEMGCVEYEPGELPHIGRFINIKIKNYGIIPDGKQGAGNKAWLFIDEIIVN